MGHGCVIIGRKLMGMRAHSAAFKKSDLGLAFRLSVVREGRGEAIDRGADFASDSESIHGS